MIRYKRDGTQTIDSLEDALELLARNEVWATITKKAKMSNLYGDEYAKVVWRAEDVQSINGAWSLERCEEWLQDNERHISDRLIELGWEVIDVLLRETSDD